MHRETIKEFDLKKRYKENLFFKPENLLTVRLDEGSRVPQPDNPVTQQPSNPSPEVNHG